MKQLLKKSLQAVLLVPLIALGVTVALEPAPVAAQDLTLGGGADSAAGTDHEGTSLFAAGGIFETVTNILLFLIGAIAVIMLVIGGIRYVVSGGDQAAVTSAKNTILYAIVGIVVAFLAYAAVQFVIGGLQDGTAS